MDPTGAGLSSVWWLLPPTNAGPSAPTGPSKTGGSSYPSAPPPSACSTGYSITLWFVVTSGESFRMKEAR
jgi:hypothetical protein